MHQSLALWGRPKFFVRRCGGACHLAAEARMTHSSEEAWALEDGHHGRVDDHTAHGSSTNLAGVHVPHAAEVILGCEQIGQYLPPQICYESYSATEILLYSALLLPGVNP